MRELSDDECNRMAQEVFGYPCQNLATDNSLIRAGYAAGYRAAQEAMPPREPTRGMIAVGMTASRLRVYSWEEIWRAMHDAWTQEQTSGEPRVPVRVPCPNKVDGVCPLPNVHCAYPECTEGTAPLSHVTPAQAVTDGPAADPIADLCARLRSHYTRGGSFDFALAADALERLARERDDTRAMLRNTNHDAARLASLVDKYKWQVRDTRKRAERAEAERDTLRAIVRAADALRIELFPHGVCCKCEHCVLVVAYDRARAKWGGES